MREIREDIKKAEENIYAILVGLSEKYEGVCFDLCYDPVTIHETVGFSKSITKSYVGNVKITASIK